MNPSYTTTITVDQTPQEVFTAITNVREWWSGEIGGSTDKLDDVFTYRYKNLHTTTQKVTEFLPGKKLVWHVLDASINFVDKKDEWKGTDIVFEISEKDDKTVLHFTHVGLVPQFECYSACSKGWDELIKGNLQRLIATGKSQPDVFS